MMTTDPRSAARSWCAPIRLAPRRTSCGGCFDRNIGFSVTARTNAQVQGAIAAIAEDPRRWKPARRQDGKRRKGAAVAEVSDLVDLSEWPPDTRLIIRREPLHPGAQQSLFPSLEYRYWGHYTDQKGNPVARDVFHRAHAHVEDHIERLKDSGLERLPFTDLEANPLAGARVLRGGPGALVPAAVPRR